MDYEPAVETNSNAVAPEPISKVWLAFGVVGIFAAFLALDAMLPSYFGGDNYAWGIMLNVAVAQLTLLCVWGTLVEGTFWFRVPWTILLLTISWAALAFGVFLNQGPVDSQVILALGLVWFFGFAVSYIPLKIAAWLFGWRITQAKTLRLAGSNQYAIRDMMIGTAILAFVISIGRFLIPGELPPWSAVLKASFLDRQEPIIAFGLFGIVSLAVKLPCIWISLAMAREKVVFWGIAWTLFSGLLGLAEFVLLSVLVGLGKREWFQFLSGLVLGHMAMAAIMIAVLCFLRLCGYGMSRVKRRSVVPTAKTG